MSALSVCRDWTLSVSAGRGHTLLQHTLVCHLSELLNDGSCKIKTRQHIKTAVSPPASSFPPSFLLLSLPLYVCLPPSASLWAWIQSIPQFIPFQWFQKIKTESTKSLENFISIQMNDYRWMKTSPTEAAFNGLIIRLMTTNISADQRK